MEVVCGREADLLLFCYINYSLVKSLLRMLSCFSTAKISTCLITHLCYFWDHDMSKNIDQIFTANPITVNASTDLMYFGQSPYGAGNDAAMAFTNFKAQFAPATVFNIANQASGTATLAPNTLYVTNNGSSLVTYTLPTVSSVGSIIKIIGKSAGLWTIVYSTNQQILVGLDASTVTTGSISSVNATDCVELVCTTANLIWTVSSQQSTGLTVV
jgi:hypothetical protein